MNDRRYRSACAALVALWVVGCAPQLAQVHRESQPGGKNHSWADYGLAGARFEGQPGLAGIVVGAPHDGFDLGTAVVASGAATILGVGYLAASGFRSRLAPLNVNRPTEGIGLPANEESGTARAAAVYQAYLEQLRLAARGNLNRLIEIHGNSRAENVGVVEIASVGLEGLRAQELKRRLGLAIPSFTFRVEPVDELHFRAIGAKTRGILSLVPLALHFELPAALRTSANAFKTGLTLGQAAADWVNAQSKTGGSWPK